jgi:hypothetical protein
LIIIRAARSPERAVEAAKKRFARMEGIRDWKIHAALIEMEAIDLEAKPKTPSYGNAEIPRTQKTSSRQAVTHEKDVGHREEPGTGRPSAERYS